MKRLALAVSLVLVLAAGGVAALNLWPDRATAQDGERVIQVVASRDVSAAYGPTLYEVGDTCSFSLRGHFPEDLWVAGAGLQLIVRDESNAIVAMMELEGEVVGPDRFGATPSADDDDSALELDCWLNKTISLPTDRAFYTVWVGDMFIRGYAASDFPLDLDYDLIYLGFD